MMSVHASMRLMLALTAASVLAACGSGARGRQSQSADVIAESTIRSHMEFLASDAMNGRGSGTRDEWIAATYIAAQLRRAGLRPISDNGDFVETVEVDRTEAVGVPVLSVGAHAIQGEQLFISRMGAAMFSGKLQIFKQGATVQSDAAVLMLKDAEPGSVKGIQAAGLLIWHESASLRSHWGDLLRRPVVVGRSRIAGLPDAPAASSPSQVVLSDEAYSSIAGLPEGSAVTLSADTHDTVSHTWNAAGRLPGSDPSLRDQVILLTAHLDHLGTRDSGVDRIYNGADDDASGSIAVLALAEALAAGPAPKRSVVFAWFGSEEAGGYGARYFVEKPVIPLDEIVANLEFEMIGRADSAVPSDTLWLTGWERSNLGAQLAAHGAKLVADPHPKENFFMRSDNFTLARKGVIAHTVSSYGLHADYHQPSDDIEHIDFTHMTGAIQSLLMPIRWLADSDFKPEWVQGGKPE
jgi:aminopeptidase YwaD